MNLLGPIVSMAVGFSNLAPSATSLLSDQPKACRAMSSMAFPNRRFSLLLALAESAQFGLIKRMKPQVIV